MGHDIDVDGETFNPGILMVGEFGSANTGELRLTARACEEILTDANIGDKYHLYHIHLNEITDEWEVDGHYLYNLEEVNNLGFGNIGLRPSLLFDNIAKSEIIMWEHKYIQRKYGEDNKWFENVSKVSANTLRVRFDDD